MSNTKEHYLVGKRVEIPTHHDLWMRGARFGRVVRVDSKDRAVVKMDYQGIQAKVKVDELEQYGRIDPW